VVTPNTSRRRFAAFLNQKLLGDTRRFRACSMAFLNMDRRRRARPEIVG
jgi:hypothetical protein